MHHPHHKLVKGASDMGAVSVPLFHRLDNNTSFLNALKKTDLIKYTDMAPTVLMNARRHKAKVVALVRLIVLKDIAVRMGLNEDDLDLNSDLLEKFELFSSSNGNARGRSNSPEAERKRIRTSIPKFEEELDLHGDEIQNRLRKRPDSTSRKKSMKDSDPVGGFQAGDPKENSYFVSGVVEESHEDHTHPEHLEWMRNAMAELSTDSEGEHIPNTAEEQKQEQDLYASATDSDPETQFENESLLAEDTTEVQSASAPLSESKRVEFVQPKESVPDSDEDHDTPEHREWISKAITEMSDSETEQKSPMEFSELEIVEQTHEGVTPTESVEFSPDKEDSPEESIDVHEDSGPSIAVSEVSQQHVTLEDYNDASQVNLSDEDVAKPLDFEKDVSKDKPVINRRLSAALPPTLNTNSGLMTNYGHKDMKIQENTKHLHSKTAIPSSLVYQGNSKAYESDDSSLPSDEIAAQFKSEDSVLVINAPESDDAISTFVTDSEWEEDKISHLAQRYSEASFHSEDMTSENTIRSTRKFEESESNIDSDYTLSGSTVPEAKQPVDIDSTAKLESIVKHLPGVQLSDNASQTAAVSKAPQRKSLRASLSGFKPIPEDVVLEEPVLDDTKSHDVEPESNSFFFGLQTPLSPAEFFNGCYIPCFGTIFGLESESENEQ